ncbi:MAG: hypothetical protein H0W40_17750 [Methylibium sp.]|uniref:hypothetical protein n=1 Tax=Methylibium sp. TaxID=2067992 RepID=UPI0017C8A8DB|nr:hypothetical protein [Methylibium sp.]MBA3599199.1 hypothetical protein [Methylibium sp.]
MRIARSQALAGVLLGAALAAGAPSAQAQAKPAGQGAIFTCVNAGGRNLTADRPIAECLDRQQRVLNSDGSLRMILQPSLTSDERAALEETERRKLHERSARLDAIRRDRNLIARYPNEAAHDRARQVALDPVRNALQASEERVSELRKERQPLMAETEFYRGKSVPAKLTSQIDAVDVSIEAQRALGINQQAELERVNGLYDAELGRLRRLWSGAEPGSLGPLPQSALAGAGR